MVQASASLQAHFLQHTVEFLNHNDSPAVLDVYTPCQGEQGIADPQANRHGRMAVESRMNPVFVHDPRRGPDLHSRFSLDGNPALDKDWSTTTLEYVEDGATKLMDIPFTPADFGLSQGRFKKQFRALKNGGAVVPLHEYIDLPAGERNGKTPFIWSVDDNKRLIKVSGARNPRRARRGAPAQLAHPAVPRRPRPSPSTTPTTMSSWKALRHQYQEAVDQRESSIDSIAKAMSESAASSHTRRRRAALLKP